MSFLRNIVQHEINMSAMLGLMHNSRISDTFSCWNACLLQLIDSMLFSWCRSCSLVLFHGTGEEDNEQENKNDPAVYTFLVHPSLSFTH